MRIKTCINCNKWTLLEYINNDDDECGLCQHQIKFALLNIVRSWHTTVGDMVTDSDDTCTHWEMK